MKNLFKNLMLVAVAAMAFTACTEEQNEVNAVKEKTTIEFVASFEDDTRSGFAAEKVDGKYVSKWDGGEEIKAIAHTAEMDVEAYTSIDEEGAGNFTAEFATEDAISSVDFYVPANSWYTWGDEPYANVPSAQTPRATSVDPLAHILRGSVDVEGNVAQGNVVFAHEFAYGKLTLNLPEDFEAEEVMLTFIGTEENETQELTLNVADLEENVLWFTTTPMSVASFTVEATAANGAIATKEATPAGALNFEKGKVTAFSVSELEVSLFDYELVLTKVTAINGNTISFEGATAQDRATIKFNPGLASIVAGTYKAVDAEYGSGFTSEDALEYNYNGSQFNLAAAYNASYDPYFGQSDIVVTDLGEGVVRIETLQKPWISGETKRVYIIFEGVLEAEEPEQLATPTGLTATVDGNNVTVSWTAVEGASKYIVTVGTQSLEVTDTTTTFTGLGYATEYNVSVVAKGDGISYTDSDAATTNVTTEAEPIIPAFTSAEVLSGSDPHDKYIAFYCSDGSLKTLIVNLTNGYNDDGTMIKVGEYSDTTTGEKIWTGEYSSYANEAIDHITMTVSYVPEGYHIVISGVTAYDTGLTVIEEATYTGEIDGLDTPNGSVQPEEPEEPGVVEIEILRHGTMYHQGNEHQIGFYTRDNECISVDFLYSTITAGTYTLTNGLSGMYCEHGSTDMTTCTAVVTDNGGGNLTFDVTYKIKDDETTYHFTYTGQIY